MYANKMVKNSNRDRIWLHVTDKEEYVHAMLLKFNTVEPGLQITEATTFQNLQKVLDFQTKQLSLIDPGGHGAGILQSNFPKF